MKAALKSFLEKLFNQKIRKYSYETRMACLLKHYGIQDIVDIGANNGQFVEWVQKAFISKRTTVHSFEPIKSAFTVLERTAKRYNDKFNWHLHHFALSDNNGHQDINISVGDATSSSLHQVTENSPVQIIGKETVVLKAFDSLKLGHIDRSKVLVKIDVQGHEMHVLRGMEKYISANRPLILIEVANLSSYQDDSSLLDFLEYFDERNYKLLWIEHNITDVLFDREWDLCFVPNEKSRVRKV